MNRFVKLHGRLILLMTVFGIVGSLVFSMFIVNAYELFIPEVFAVNELDIEDVVVTEERIKFVEVEKITNETISPVSLKEIGTFGLTAYCPCSYCCEQWAGPPEGKTTSIGVGAYKGITFAVDPTKIPYGSTMYIEGVGVGIAADCGVAIKGNRIDVYFETHQEAIEFGIGGGPKNVYIIE